MATNQPVLRDGTSSGRTRHGKRPGPSSSWMPDTRTAHISLIDSGVVVVRIRKGARQSMTDASENLATAVSETAGRRLPLLVDIRGAQPLAADVRQQYSGQRVIDTFSALALLVEASTLGRMMGNVYLSVARLAIPTQLFVEETQALEWLDGHGRK
jgi:hypothetical protein